MRRFVALVLLLALVLPSVAHAQKNPLMLLVPLMLTQADVKAHFQTAYATTMVNNGPAEGTAYVPMAIEIVQFGSSNYTPWSLVVALRLYATTANAARYTGYQTTKQRGAKVWNPAFIGQAEHGLHYYNSATEYYSLVFYRKTVVVSLTLGGPKHKVNPLMVAQWARLMDHRIAVHF